jgi:hypothetical protein
MLVSYYGMTKQSNEDYGHGLDRVVSQVEPSGYAVV